MHGFREGRNALALFVVQLGANALWTWVFFVWRQGAFAFAEVILLWCLIVATVASFWRLNAAAAALTFSTWRLNPDLL